MQHWFKWSFLCFGILCGLSAGAIVFGHELPKREFVPEIAACGDLLCYLNIEPGITTEHDAQSILNQVAALSTDDSLDRWVHHTAKPFYRIWLFPNETYIVAQVEMYFSQT